MGLYNKYVDKMCHTLLHHNFLSVYSYDTFPLNIKNKSLPCSFIINLSKRKEPGSHFVCIYISESVIEYMDSYGLPPFMPRIKKFITVHKEARAYSCNEHMIQSVTSLFCGYYCTAFLLSKDLNYSMSKFVNLFINKSGNKDKIVVKFIKNAINNMVC